MSYKPLSPTLWNTISFKAEICHFSTVYRNASHNAVPWRTVSSQKVENQMGTNIPGQNKIRGAASYLHKYYPPVMHLGQGMKSFICKVNTWCCQRGLIQPHKPSEFYLAAHTSLSDNFALFMGPQGESQLGFYLCTTYFFFLLFFWLGILFIFLFLFAFIHTFSALWLRIYPVEPAKLSGRQKSRLPGPSVKGSGSSRDTPPPSSRGTLNKKPFTFLYLIFPIIKWRAEETADVETPCVLPSASQRIA